MSEKIQTIDVQVYPNWGGGAYPASYYDPQTLEKRNFNTFADQELVTKWQQRVLDVAQDPTRFLLHVHENYCGYGKEYLLEYLSYIDANSAPGRFATIYQRNLDVPGKLRELVENMQIQIADQVRVVAYGHHHGDCVPRVGRQVVSELGLPEISFEENEELSVWDVIDARLHLITSVNPVLGSQYSIEHFNALPRDKVDQRDLLKKLYSQQRYLLLYCTSEQVVSAARQAQSVEEFELLIGGSFREYNFIEDQRRILNLVFNETY